MLYFKIPYDNSVNPPALKELGGDSAICNPFGILIPKGIRLVVLTFLGVRAVNCVCTLFILSNITLIIDGTEISHSQTFGFYFLFFVFLK